MEALSLAPRRLLLVDPCDQCRRLQPHLEEAGWLVSSQSLDQAQAASYDIGLLRLRTEHLLRPEGVKHLISRSGTEWIALVDPLAEDVQGLDEFIGEWFFDALALPVDLPRLQGLLGRAFGIARLRGIGTRRGDQHELLGQSRPLRELRKQLARLGPSDRPVLILGESGSGKELVARTLHRMSRRVGQPFVSFNCGMLPEAETANLLFSHQGKLVAANGGTLFLDAIHDLPQGQHERLLNCLRSKVLRHADGESLALDLRVLASSREDLEERVEQGTFHPGLRQWLEQNRLTITPLRKRQGDIALLASYFVELYSLEAGRRSTHFSEEALAAMVRHRWPGNVRELASRVRRGYALAEGGPIEADDLGLHSAPVDAVPLGTLEDYKRRAEYQALCDALAHYSSNLSHAAKVLGVSRPTFYRLLHKHQLL
ncbi:sigma-54-dependent transcriptional regulator [Metapseudomonas furukawaii]|uniref:sigma-54-dependent transcriptional regulator n=1 Tax=Metapseudomonas furukawaii TaxID=1149133 RepID=UPI00227B2F0C|nr:sigma-54 dependent transcriptional regulator [Pseudomonas furukawaii]WAG81490.1 sigma-54 dependent transcriptional regulator [Pseudomonas furukawaii]